MGTGNESKRRSPSIIARLMGLDGLPPQNSSHKQSKTQQNHQRRSVSSQKAPRGSTSHGHRSFRKSSEDEQVFKDVFEVTHTPKVESNRYMNQRSEIPNLTDGEMAFIQHKLMEVKQLSMDKSLQNSRRFHDAVEAPDSRKDLLLRFFQQPESLFPKHRQAVQTVVSRLQDCQVPSVEPYNGYTKHAGGKSKAQTIKKNQSKSSNCSHTRQAARGNAPGIPKTEFQETNGSKPTMIVVLKPNIGKMNRVDTTLSSPSSSDDSRADSRLPCTRSREVELWGKRKVDEVGSLTRHNSRQIATEITRDVRTRDTKQGSLNFQASLFRGYAGDESSSGSDAESEESIKLTPDISFKQRNLRSVSSRLDESSVSKEAKKRMSERWRLTHRSERVREISRSSTLAEMLSFSDREARPASFNGLVFDEGISKRSECKNEQNELPLGISSRDGWKDGCMIDLPKHPCLRGLSSAPGSPRTSKNCGNVRDYNILTSNEVMKKERNKLMKGGSLSHWEEFLSSHSRPSSKKSQSLCSSSPEFIFTPSEHKGFLTNQNFQQNLSPSGAHTSYSPVINSATTLGYAGDVKSTESSKPFHLEESASTSSNDPKSVHDVRLQDPFEGSSKGSSHSSVPEQQAPETKEEDEQPSPVSVLESSVSEDDSSSPEFFESLSADLHGLRKQLQLLKRESGVYEEGHMLVSSDEEWDIEEFTRITDENMATQQSEEDWKLLYLDYVFENARFSDACPDSFMASWHSSESPLSPSLFEELEKKQSFPGSSTHCERKLLFDLINLELLEIFKLHACCPSWVKPTKICPKWDINELQDAVHKSVTKKVEEENEHFGALEMESESQWWNLEYDIEVIGREIEKLMIDELITEMVTTV